MNTPYLDYLSERNPNGDTYMSQICTKIFSYSNISILQNVPSAADTTCQDWFAEAVGHCNELLLMDPEIGFSWLLYKMLNIKFLLFPKLQSTSLINMKPYMQVHPNMLNSIECNRLFAEIAKDYVHVAPKYTALVEDHFYFWSLLKTFMGVLVMYLLYIFVANLAENMKWMKFPTASCIKILTEEEMAMTNKMRFLSNCSLKAQYLDMKYLHINNLDPTMLFVNPPLFTISIGRNTFSEAICCLVHSEPLLEVYSKGDVIEYCRKDRAYALHKIDQFLSRTSRCRIVVDFELNPPDSDEDNYPDIYEESLNRKDSGPSESALDDTADSSSLGSSSQRCRMGRDRYKHISSRYKEVTQFLQRTQKPQSNSSYIKTSSKRISEKSSSTSINLVRQTSSKSLQKIQLDTRH